MNKCKTCLVRYVCGQEYEYECLTNDYRHYMEDTQKIQDLEKEKDND